MSEIPEDFILSRWVFSAKGASPTTQSHINEDEPAWFHCQRDSPYVRKWLEEQAVSSAIIESLLADDTRPRFELFDDDTFLVNLRSINPHDEHEPDDMLSVRMLWYKNSLITTRKTPTKVISSISESLKSNNGPSNLPALFIAIIKGITNQISEFVLSLETELDELSIENKTSQTSIFIHETKQVLLRLNRYLKPQKYVLEDLLQSQVSMLAKQEFHLKNGVDTITRINESIDFCLSQIDQHLNHIDQIQSDRMNKNTYFLSAVAGIFLPASFVTGLLGINLGGIPGTDSSNAFIYFSSGLVLFMLIEILIFKKLKLI